MLDSRAHGGRSNKKRGKEVRKERRITSVHLLTGPGAEVEKKASSPGRGRKVLEITEIIEGLEPPFSGRRLRNNS